MTTKIWKTTENSVEDALNLPEGSFAADFGFWVEQSVSPDRVLEAATAFKEQEVEVTVASQAALIVKAQEKDIAFTDWAKLAVM